MEVKEQIIEMEQLLQHAMLNSDVEVLDSLIADSLIFTDHMGNVINKQMDLEAHSSGSVIFESLEPAEQVIEDYQKTAIVSVLMNIKGSFMNEPVQAKVRFLRVWVKLDDSWLVVAGNSALVAN